MSSRPRVVIIGGGFGGLYAAQSLRGAPLEVTLVDRRNFHLFQPLLYQVATGGLSPGDVSSPLRYVLRRQKNARVLLAEAVDFDVAARKVLLRDGEALEYDFLVVATGAQTNYFSNQEWQERAPGLKSVEDATEIRRRILTAFETAERHPEGSDRDAWLTFVVIGGGPTGVELAGSIAELARDTLPRDFRHIDTRRARIVLVEGRDRLLPAFSEKLSRAARQSLMELGVEVRTDTMVKAIEAGRVRLEGPDGQEELAARTVLWGAGVRASPLGETLAERTGAETDRGGRLMVEPDLSLKGHPEIMVIGDLACFTHQTGSPLPGVAPVAIQQGKHVSRVVRARMQGKQSGPAFRYSDRGNLATIGRSRAVAEIGPVKMSGLPAWLLWVVVHIYWLIEFENRLLVLIQWAWSYFTWNRSARLITGADGRGGPADHTESGGTESSREGSREEKKEEEAA